MKKFLIVAVLVLSGFGFAQSGFAGGSVSGLYFSSAATSSSIGFTLGFIGGQVGSYDLLGPLGGRITADVSVTPLTGILSGTADLLVAFGDDNVKGYGGAGVGILSFLGETLPIGKAFVGVDFAVSDSVSLFAEAAPIYAFEANNFLFGGRFGVNFGFGQ